MGSHAVCPVLVWPPVDRLRGTVRRGAVTTGDLGGGAGRCLAASTAGSPPAIATTETTDYCAEEEEFKGPA